MTENAPAIQNDNMPPGRAAKAQVIYDGQCPLCLKSVAVLKKLDSEVAIVKVDGKELVFDPGTPNAPYGIVAWQKGHVSGLKLVKKQDASWFETPPLNAADALITRKAALRVDGDALKGKITLIIAPHTPARAAESPNVMA